MGRCSPAGSLTCTFEPFVRGYPDVVYLSSAFCALWGNDKGPSFPNNVAPDADKVVMAVMFYSSHFCLVVVTGHKAVICDSYTHYASVLRDAMITDFLKRLAEHRNTTVPFELSMAEVPQQEEKENTCAIHVVNNIVRACLKLSVHFLITTYEFDNELTRKTLAPGWTPKISEKPVAHAAVGPAPVPPTRSAATKFPMNGKIPRMKPAPKAPPQKKDVAIPLVELGESTSDSDSGDDSEDDSDEGRGEESSEEEGPPPLPTRAKMVKPAGENKKQLWVCAGCTFEKEMNVKKYAMCKAYKAVVLSAFID